MRDSVTIGVIAAFWLGVGLIQTFNWGGGLPKAAVMLCFLLAIFLVIAQARRMSTPLPPWLDRTIVVAFWFFLALDLSYLSLRIVSPHLIDIATTTLAAGHALLHGGNPYALAIDGGPESAGFTGYKYLPMMIAAYLPLGAPLGQRGVLLTNLVLFLACLWLMKRLGRSLLAPFLFLMLPLVAEQIFAKGATDLAAVMPLLAAFVLREKSAFAAGVCVGLSIAAKPVPGILFLPCVVPAAGRGRYALGVVVGLLPILPFLAWSPHDLIANTMIFNLTRVADNTAWLFAAPKLVTTAHLVVAALYAGACLYLWRNPATLATRCGVGAMLTLATILAGPGAHHNYQLWWLPFYAVSLALALAPAGDEACQDSPSRYTSARMDARGS